MSSIINAQIATLTRAEYDGVDATNWSTFKLVDRAPVFAKEALTTPKEDTDALRLGRSTHAAILEPALFSRTHAVWQGGRRYGKEWDAFKAANMGRELLTQDEHELCLAMSRSARTDEHAGPYLAGGRSEVTLLYEVKAPNVSSEFPGYVEKMKSRIDFVSKRDVILDVKTCRDASPRIFGNEATKFLYTAQAALYRAAYEAATGKRLPYWLVAIEKSPPYVVQIYKLTDAQLQRGRDKYRQLLDAFVYARLNNDWKGYADGPVDFEEPAWVAGGDNDITGLGLTFNQGAGT